MSDTKDKLLASCRAHLSHTDQLSQLWCDVSRDDHAHHLDLSTENPGQVAYSPDGVAADDHKRRRRLTLGRYLARQCGILIDSTIERGINKVVADMLFAFGESSDEEFTVLRGDDVTQAYVDRVGARSCMVGECNSHITKWFSLFPENVGLVVWRKTEGRALLWTDKNGQKVLDRIYAGNHQLAKERYASWCKENGVVDGFGQFGFSNVEECGNTCVRLGRRAVDGRPVPYLDTFYHADDSGNFYNYSARGCCYECQDTDGNLGNGESCHMCGDRVDEDHAYSTDDGYCCESCYCANYASCHRCGETYHNESGELVTVDGDSEYCSSCRDRICAHECEHCNEWSTDCSNVDGQTWCESCVENNATCCEKCGDCVPCDDARDINGETWCDPCADSHAQRCHDCKTYFPLDVLAEVNGQHYCECCEPETDDLLTIIGG